MRTFIKVQAASVLGSILDYLTTIIGVEIFHFGYLQANFGGNICGGTAQFFLCRNWAFKADGGRMEMQATRFILVFIGNIILSAVGIYFFTHYLGINYIISKTVTSVLLGISYNYLMQKKYVFN